MNPRYNSIDNTSPFQQALENDKPKISYTAFPFGRSHAGNMSIGTLEILDCFDTIPGGRYDLNLDLLIKTRAPLKRRIFNGCRVYVDAWYNSWSDLWEAAENHVDHGRSGLLDISKPSFDGLIVNSSDALQMDFFTPNSVANQLGFPVRTMVKYGTETHAYKSHPLYSYCPTDVREDNLSKIETVQDYRIEGNALPFAMYQRLAIDKYYPKNLIQGNKNALPDNKEKQRISYSLTKLNALNSSGGVLEKANYNDNYINPNSAIYTLDPTGDYTVKLGCKRFAQRKGDYFSTSSIFPDLVRGSLPEEDLPISNINIDFSDSFGSAITSEAAEEITKLKTVETSNPDGYKILAYNDSGDEPVNMKDKVINALNQAKIANSVTAKITANIMRRLLVATLIKERAARTNGDYISYVEAMYGKKPQVHDFTAKHIGSFYQDIVFSDVTQTSATTEGSPLGKQAGQALSASSGNLGSFTSGDYGIIMIVAHIVPDDFYNQGVPRWLCELGSDSVYLPLQNNLPPQAIKRREIFATNNASTNADVWSYTEFGEDEKARDNYASGFVGLPKSLSLEDGYFLMHTHFGSMPEMNPNFNLLIPQNVDMEVFAVTDEPPFVFNAVTNITKYESRPYNTLPMDFGAKY